MTAPRTSGAAARFTIPLAVKLAVLAGFFALNGCCLDVISGLSEDTTGGSGGSAAVTGTNGTSQGASGTSGGIGSTESSGATTGQSVEASSGTSSGASSGSTGTGTTSGSATGSSSASGTSGGPVPCGVPVGDQSTTVSTLAGNGTQGFFDGSGGRAGTTQFYNPAGLAVDAAGNVLVADWGNDRIRKVDPNGNTTTIAGDGVPALEDGQGGPHDTAEFGLPYSLAIDAIGNLLVVDFYDLRIRQIDGNGNVTTLPCTGTEGIPFSGPIGIAVDSSGRVLLTDSGNNRVCRFGLTDGLATALPIVLNHPWGVAVGPDGSIYIADTLNNIIRRIDSAGHAGIFAGNGVAGYADGPAATAEFFGPTGLVVDPQGNVIVADLYRVRRIDPAGSVTTLAGDGHIGGDADGTGGPNGTAELNGPRGVAIDKACNVYVTDIIGNRIRKITFGS
jgi:sugar lactone lactonase YvrE